jgi:hypothetical protein
MWNNAPRPVGQLWWLTGLGLPLVFRARRRAASRMRSGFLVTTPPLPECGPEMRAGCQWRAAIERPGPELRLGRSTSCAVSLTSHTLSKERCERSSAGESDSLERKPAVRGQVKQHTSDDIASALSRLRTTNEPQRTTNEGPFSRRLAMRHVFAGLRPLDRALWHGFPTTSIQTHY